MKKILYCLSMSLLVACESQTTSEMMTHYEAKISTLQNLRLQDSLLLHSLHNEMDIINDVLDSAQSLNALFAQSGQTNRQHAITKIKGMTLLLEESQAKVKKLEEDLQAAQSALKNSPIVQQPVATAAATIDKQLAYYRKLEATLQALKKENIELKQYVEEQKQVIIIKDTKLAELEAKKVAMQQALGELNQAIGEANSRLKKALEEVENTKKDAKNQKARIYYDIGLELKKSFDNLNAKWAQPKISRQLVDESYELFSKSYQLGYPEAQREMLILKDTEPYNKYLSK